MTHDPLCYLYRDDGEYNLMADRCSNCKLIAKVRADCLEKVEGAYIVGSDGKVLNPRHPEYSHDGTETWNSAIDLAVAYMTGKID